MDMISRTDVLSCYSNILTVAPDVFSLCNRSKRYFVTHRDIVDNSYIQAIYSQLLSGTQRNTGNCNIVSLM